MRHHRSNEDLIQAIDGSHARISSVQRDLFALIVQADREEVWQGSGARGMAHWLCMRQGISEWKAHRWIAAAHALELLPRISEAFGSGELGIDKVVELCRFATAETEAGLVGWANTVSGAHIRHRADLEARREIAEVREAERTRHLDWDFFDEGRCFDLRTQMPAAGGAVVATAIERQMAELPVMPGEEDLSYAAARRADALVAICSAQIAADADPDRATVVVHARLDGLVSCEGAAELGAGPVIHPETARRLLCDARVETVLEDDAGTPLRLGRATRVPTPSMVRQLRYRDRECRFPGCGARRFTQAHHIVWWRNGGPTDLENLVLVCSFHHKLVHELGWALKRSPDGSVAWFRPDGRRYLPGPRAGPGPPRENLERRPALVPLVPDLRIERDPTARFRLRGGPALTEELV